MQQKEPQHPPTGPLVLTIAQTEQALNISTVNRLVKAGKLKKLIPGHGSVRITTASLYSLLKTAWTSS